MAICTRYGRPAGPFKVVACQASHGSGCRWTLKQRAGKAAQNWKAAAFQAAVHINVNLQGEERM